MTSSSMVRHVEALVRVIAGKHRSRRLRSMRGMDLRPTADRLRETLFDVLTAGNPAALEGTAWIDLYAGTGAVGIEALSRGAKIVYLVESSAGPAELIRENLQSLGIADGFEVLRLDAGRALQQLQGRGILADYVFLDPPYRKEEEYVRTLNGLSHSRLLKAESLVIAEHHRKFDPGDRIASLVRYRLLKQGDAALSFYRGLIDTVREIPGPAGESARASR